MKKVSIIIPVYNEERCIEECLVSLSKQSYNDLEIIIVDDGSTDNTLKFAKTLQNKLELVILVQKHKGPGAGRNLGAKHATGDVLVFVDADMTFDPNFIADLVAPILQGKQKGTFSKNEYVSNWDNVWARCLNIEEGWEPKKRHPKNYPDKQKVFRAILKTEFDNVGGFTPGGYTDDWSLSEKLGYEAIAVKSAKFYHRNPDNLGEVFEQSKWVGKRKYKLGIIGTLFALLRSSFPVSVVIGAYKSIINRTFKFLVFKITYDLGRFVGIVENNVLGDGVK